MQYLIPHFGLDNFRAMIFVDGENLAIRFAAQIKKQSLEKQSLSQRPKRGKRGQGQLKAQVFIQPGLAR